MFDKVVPFSIAEIISLHRSAFKWYLGTIKEVSEADKDMGLFLLKESVMWKDSYELLNKYIFSPEGVHEVLSRYGITVNSKTINEFETVKSVVYAVTGRIIEESKNENENEEGEDKKKQ